MKKIPRVREGSVKKFPSVTVTGGTSICLRQNGALWTLGDKELQTSKVKNTDFERYGKCHYGTVFGRFYDFLTRPHFFV